ncbi:MAG TPA: hypothetical protein VGQ83_12805 [Polyangia bacterium]|jgi:hypothetical protein
MRPLALLLLAALAVLPAPAAGRCPTLDEWYRRFGSECWECHWAHHVMRFAIDRSALRRVYPDFDVAVLETQLQLGMREWWANGESPVEPRYVGDLDCGSDPRTWPAGTVCIWPVTYDFGGIGYAEGLQTFGPGGGDFGGGGVTKARIWLAGPAALARSGLAWDVSSSCAAWPEFRESFREVVTHEAGHLLGIGHCDDDTADNGVVMNAQSFRADPAGRDECDGVGVPPNPAAGRTRRYVKRDELLTLRALFPWAAAGAQRRYRTDDLVAWSADGASGLTSAHQLSTTRSATGRSAWAQVLGDGDAAGASHILLAEGREGVVDRAVAAGETTGAAAVAAGPGERLTVAWVGADDGRRMHARARDAPAGAWGPETVSTPGFTVDDGHVELEHDPLSGRYLFGWRGRRDRVIVSTSDDGLEAGLPWRSAELPVEVAHGPKIACGSYADAEGYNCIIVYALADGLGHSAWSRLRVLGGANVGIDGVHEECAVAWGTPDVVTDRAGTFVRAVSQQDVTFLWSLVIGDPGWQGPAGVATPGAREPSLGWDQAAPPHLVASYTLYY